MSDKVGGPVAGMPLTWVVDGADKPFEPMSRTEHTWLDELGDWARERDRELRKARQERERENRERCDRRDDETSLTWV